MATVLICGIDGEAIYGPTVFNEPPTLTTLKQDLLQTQQKACTQVRILLQNFPLSDDDKIEGGTLEAPVVLTKVVVPCTHSAVVWGGGTDDLVPEEVKSQLKSGVVSVSANPSAFAVVKEDGSVIAWDVDDGPSGDTSAVGDELSSDVISITASGSAFAALKRNGRVVTWGDADYGGDSSEVGDMLKSGIISVTGTYGAFAALTENGRVLTWGDADYGGDSSAVAESLADEVVSVHNKRGFQGSAFAALKADGSVVTWGSPAHGGDSCAVQEQLQGEVLSLCGTNDAFAALLKQNGRVVAWGPVEEDDSEDEEEADLGDEAWQKCPDGHHLKTRVADSDFVCVICQQMADEGSQEHSCKRCGYWCVCAKCFALKLTGESQDIPFDDVAEDLSCDVVAISASDNVFAAIKASGKVVTWGNKINGADLQQTNVAGQLASGVVSITTGIASFAALKEDGSVITWGVEDWGGDSSMVAEELATGVKAVFAAEQSNGHAFAALKVDGSVVTWGEDCTGGDSSEVADDLASGIVTIVGNDVGFIALKEIPISDIQQTTQTSGNGYTALAVPEQL